MEFLVVPWLGKAAHAQSAGCGWSGPHPRKLDVGSVSQQLPRCVRERESKSLQFSEAWSPDLLKGKEGDRTACGLFSALEFSLWDPLSWTSILCAECFPAEMVQLLNVPPLEDLTPLGVPRSPWGWWHLKPRALTHRFCSIPGPSMALLPQPQATLV